MKRSPIAVGGLLAAALLLAACGDPPPTATPIPLPTATPIPPLTATAILPLTATAAPPPTATAAPPDTATPILPPTATTAPASATPVPPPTDTVVSGARPTPDTTLFQQPVMVLEGGDATNPRDATPSLDGKTIYFTASSPQGAAVYRVDASGGAAQLVAGGNPFLDARTLALSPDSRALLVADPQAAGGGQIFVLAPTGGAPTPLHGSAGTAPQNLTVATVGGQRLVYFTGTEPGGKEPAVFKLPAGGADAPQLLAHGAPLVAPDGIAVTAAGVVYVADRGPAGGAGGTIFRIDGGRATPLVAQVRLGNPAGIALAHRDTLLLVSAFQTAQDQDELLVVDLISGQTGAITRVVGQNTHAGGLHAAPGDHPLFAWTDLTGGVYRINGR